MLELRREVGNVSTCVLSDGEHLTKVRFGLGMTLESVLISALFLADLTEPSQTLKSLGLHLISEILWSSDYIQG